jgi:hypothetical protein
MATSGVRTPHLLDQALVSVVVLINSTAQRM